MYINRRMYCAISESIFQLIYIIFGTKIFEFFNLIIDYNGILKDLLPFLKILFGFILSTILINIYYKFNPIKIEIQKNKIIAYQFLKKYSINIDNNIKIELKNKGIFYPNAKGYLIKSDNKKIFIIYTRFDNVDDFIKNIENNIHKTFGVNNEKI